MPKRPRASRPVAARRARAPRPGAADTRTAIVDAATAAFAAQGFAGVRVDEVARAAGVNKAMIYYHFADKLDLYRAIVAGLLREAAERVAAIADQDATPQDKLGSFVAAIGEVTETHPHFPVLMMREISEGAPRLDADTLARMRGVFEAFGRILAEGHARGVFRPVHPMLGYMTVLAPLVFNAARERMAERPGRSNLPMFVHLSHDEIVRHLQHVALRAFAKD